MRIVPAALAVAIVIVLAGHIPEIDFLILAVVVGLPHGAFDHKTGRRAFVADYGARWWQPFLAGYLGLAGLMLLLWWAAPVLALSMFLLLSILHFGDQDASAKAPYRIEPIVAHGGVPIIVSAACHPEAIVRLLAALVPSHAYVTTVLLGGPLMLVWVAAAGATLVGYAARGQTADWTAGLDLLLVALLFGLAPPLIAFSLYFAAIHAPRAFATTIPAGGLSAGELILPLFLTLLGLGLGVAIFVAGAGAPIEDNLVRSAFLLLSMLTVPHMWLEWRARVASTNTPAVRSKL